MSDAGPRFGLSRLRMSSATALRLLASIALALLLWGWVTLQQDPLTTRYYPNVGLEAAELEDNLQLVGTLDDVAIRVGLEGPRSVVRDVRADEIRPHLDLGAIDGAGTYTVPIEISAPDAVQVREIEPSRLSIVVDETIAASIRVDTVLLPPSDGTRRIGEIEPDPSSVTVAGPRAFVERVERVILQIDIGDRTTTFTDRFVPVAVDELGQPITGVEIRPQRVAAAVPIETRGRSVPVLVQTVGNPAQGYEAVDREAMPNAILLDGPDAVIDQIVSVSTGPVRIEGATAPVRQSVGLTGLPPGVTVVEPAGGNVDALVQIVPRGTSQALSAQTIRITDVAPGLNAEVDPGSVRVDVYATQERLAELRAGDVVPSVSATGLAAGTHRVPLTVTVPSGVQWLGSDPPEVTLTLAPSSETPSATPIGSGPPATPA